LTRSKKGGDGLDGYREQTKQHTYTYHQHEYLKAQKEQKDRKLAKHRQKRNSRIWFHLWNE